MALLLLQPRCCCGFVALYWCVLLLLLFIVNSNSAHSLLNTLSENTVRLSVLSQKINNARTRKLLQYNKCLFFIRSSLDESLLLFVCVCLCCWFFWFFFLFLVPCPFSTSTKTHQYSTERSAKTFENIFDNHFDYF